MKLVSLFAGAGGLDLGLELAGFRTVAANEIQPHACQTLRANRALPRMTPREYDDWFAKQLSQRCYSNITPAEADDLKRRVRPSLGTHGFLRHARIIPGDIRSLSSANLLEAARAKPGELTLVAGGPPCQPFSRAGKRQSVEASDGKLFLEFVRVVKDLRPRWFLFENVKGLVLTKTDVVMARCPSCGRTKTATFDERLAYFAGDLSGGPCSHCKRGTTEPYSERVAGGSLDIILREFAAIGYKCVHTVLNAADFGVPQIRERLIIVGSRDNERFEWPIETHGSGPDGDTQQHGLFDTAEPKTPWINMRQALWTQGHPEFGMLDENRAVLWVKNVVRPHDEPVTWSLNRPSPTIGAHQGAKLAIAPEGVPEAQLKRQQWHTLGRRQGDNPPVYVKHAYLSDEELLNLQTFPTHWYLYGTRMERAFQIGNAVPVKLAQALGTALANQCTPENAQRITYNSLEPLPLEAEIS